MLPSSFYEFYNYGFLGTFCNPWNWSSETNKWLIALFVASVFALIVASYLLGSINFAIIISGKHYKQDIRNFGSKNAGMTNMMRTYGKKAAAFTLIGDALKAVVSCALGYLVIGNMGAYIAGLFCIIGHVFPAYYRFKGGKGVVTALITILMCDPFVFAVWGTLFILIVLCTRYISLASVMCMLLYPVLLAKVPSFVMATFFNIADFQSVGIPFAIAMAVLIVAKHWTNIKRLLNGSESKFVFKKSVKAHKDGETEESKESK